MKQTKKITGILLIAAMLVGCNIQAPGMTKGRTANEQVQKVLPLVDEYDEGLSKAQFITAPIENAETETKGEHTSYTASYKMVVENTEANFVLGDSKGEYGQLILCGIRESADEDCFILRVFEDGTEVNASEYHQEVLISDDNYQLFETRLEVQAGENSSTINVNINGEEVGSFNIPTFSLGCVGTYKSRGTTTAGMDDILVLEGEDVLIEETFDGVFTNNLYEYAYDPEQHPENIFAPNPVKTRYDSKGKSLIVTSGFILSDTRKDGAPVFKKSFDAQKKDIESAYVYMTALGSFDIELNGQRVLENFFDPGKMVYNKYLNYVSYDVTDKITDSNEIMIYLFHGFFDRGVGYPEAMSSWGRNLAIRGEVVINYKGGVTVVIPTDDSFEVTRDSRYRFDDIYQGEIIDDRFDLAGDAKWNKAVVAGPELVDEEILKAPVRHKENESIAAVSEISPVSVSEISSGRYVYDFGANIAGTVKFTLGAKELAECGEGHVITFRYGELLNNKDMVNSDGEEGTVWTQNLLTSRNTDHYIVGNKALYEGEGKELSFSHTYHGFRYVEVTGLPGGIPLDNIKAEVLSSNMEVTGQFGSENDIVNLFLRNSERSLAANMIDAPTDCPQRDERLAWTGDAQAVSAFAMYRYDAEAFYRNYLLALRSQQGENGFMRDVVYTRGSDFGGHSCWGDALVTITWNHYLQYGDKSIIEENIDAACKWVEYLEGISADYLVNTGGYGDHLSQQGTDMTLSDTAWSAHSARLVSKMCHKLGDDARAEKYAALADKFTDKWQKTYIRSDASVDAGIIWPEYESETAYALGIEFSLFPEDMMADAAARLKLLTEYGGYLFYPGYSGMEFYLPALCDYGYTDTAVMVLTNSQPGGMVHPLSMGLTTNPEELGCFRYEDYSGEAFGDGRYMVTGSLNHAAFSSVGEMYYRNLLGIKPDEEAPGYEHFFLQPCVTDLIGEAGGSYKCRFGEIRVDWNTGSHQMSCTVPEGTTCTLTLPDGSTKELTAGDHKFTWN